MSEQADAYYIGTIVFDLKSVTLPLFNYEGTVRVRDEFVEALEEFKGQYPEFTGKIVKSIVVADMSLPTAKLSGNLRPACKRMESVFGNLHPIFYE